MLELQKKYLPYKQPGFQKIKEKTTDLKKKRKNYPVMYVYLVLTNPKTKAYNKIMALEENEHEP